MSKAAEFYSRVPKTHNCVQSVAAAAGREDLVGALKSNGGGRTPEGRCGALHAALLIAPAEKHETIRKSFLERAGSEFCRELRAAGQTPCVKCVEIGGELL